MITFSIELSKIPKEKVKKADNGKLYCNIVVSELKEIDEHGNTHKIELSRTKEEREANAERIYIGRGKEYRPIEIKQVTPEAVEMMPCIDDCSDLPF